MTLAIKQNVIVQPGGVIEVHMPQLPAGTSAEVIVLVEQEPSVRPSLAELIGIGRGLYGGVDQIDTYLNQLREEWSGPA